MRVLVMGATGYVGRRLVPLLVERGHEVRVSTRDGCPSDPLPWWSGSVEVVAMDVLDASQVESACEGIEVVYYLVHGMGGEDFVAQDAEAAMNVRAAVDAHGVARMIYLSGLVPHVEVLSDHLASRLEVEQILSSAGAVVITLRAAVLLGSGSTSFEIVRQVAERLPVHTVPDWMQSRVQPIAVIDALEALLGAIAGPAATRHYDIGGLDTITYPDLIATYTRIAGLHRSRVRLPLVPTVVVGEVVAQLTDVPDSTVRALVESLHYDMVCDERDFITDLLPQRYALMSLEEAIRRALAPQRGSGPAADLMAPIPEDPAWADGGSSLKGGLLSYLGSAAAKVLPPW